jgi:nucleoid DNA-binding protein
MTGGTIDVTVVNDPPTARSPLYEDDGNSGENPFYTSDAVVVVGYGDFSISKRSARTGRNPQTGKEIQIPADESDRAIANRLLSSVKSSQCPEDGRDRCIVEAVKGSEMYADLAAQGDIEILMTLTADPLAAPKEGSGDCDDTDPGIRPDRCRTSYPVDLDGDGLDDLAVEGVSGHYTWTIDGEVVGNATVHISRAAGEQVVFMQVGTLGGETSRAELVEAIASHSGLSKADSKKALDGFIDTTAKASVSDCCFDYNKRTETSGDEIKSPVSSKEIDKATPKLAEEVARKDARIAELEARIAELEADGEVNTSAKASEDQGNDRVVRKKPGRAESGNDMDSDGDGLGDGSEEDVAPSRDRRPGFVNNLLRSIFG